MWSGLIFAPTKKLGVEIKRELGLKYWFVVTPETLSHAEGVQVEPRMLAVDDDGHRPISIDITRLSIEIVNICAGKRPAVWHIRRSP